MKVSIIGSGTVGQATGIGFAQFGNDVLFFDIDKEKLASLKKEGFKTTDKIVDTVIESEVLFVCVPTPNVNGRMDFSYVQKAVADIAKAMRRVKEYRVVAIRSTVLPTTTRCRIIPILIKYSKLKEGRDFGVCANPEFLREKYALEDFMKPYRIVVGELDKRSGDFLEKLYTPFKAPIFRLDLDSAEMVKYVSNCFLASKISFFNEIYMICSELGLDPIKISEIVSLDPRIGTYGIYGGKPFSGSCLPKDLEAFVNFVKSKGINPKMLDASLKINKQLSKSCSECSKS